MILSRCAALVTMLVWLSSCGATTPLIPQTDLRNHTITALETEKKVLRQQLDRLEAMYDFLRNENSKMIAANGDLEEQLSDQKDQLLEEQERADTAVQNQLITARALEKARKEKKVLIKNNQLLKLADDASRVEIEALKLQQIPRDAEISSLRAKKNILEAERTALQDDLRKSKQHIEQLKQNAYISGWIGGGAVIVILMLIIYVSLRRPPS